MPSKNKIKNAKYTTDVTLKVPSIERKETKPPTWKSLAAEAASSTGMKGSNEGSSVAIFRHTCPKNLKKKDKQRALHSGGEAPCH